MGTPVQEQFLTAEEFYLLPDDGQRYELVRGVLVCMAATGGQHGIIASRLDYRLRAFVEAHDLGEVCAAETGFRLAQNPDTFRAPDVSFIGRERVLTQGVPEGYWPFAPDIAVVSDGRGVDCAKASAGQRSGPSGTTRGQDRVGPWEFRAYGAAPDPAGPSPWQRVANPVTVAHA